VDLARHAVPSLRDSLWLRSDRDLCGRVGEETEAALDHLKASAGGFWLHVDLDVLSTESLAAVDYRQPGGLGWDELRELTGRALADPRCLGWSVVIYNPELDDDGNGARDIVSYITTVLAN
jgi:arginase